MTRSNNKQNKAKMLSFLESRQITSESENIIELDVTELSNDSPLSHYIKTQILLNIENPISLKNILKKARLN